MDAIARVAFGLDVNSQKEKDNKFVAIVNKIFDNVSDGSAVLINLFFGR